MFLFEPNSRIQKIEDGIQFYEQDILLSEYLFSGDQKIEIKLDYLSPGFGLAIIEKNEAGLKEENSIYLAKLGSNDFRVFRRRFQTQEQIHINSCNFAPGEKMKHVTLVFELKNKTITVSRQKVEKEEKVKEELLGEFELPKRFGSFLLGFYSNAGNIIRSFLFLNKVPPHWRISVKNTMGGRICFRRNTVQFENCQHHAELEQKDIELKPGKYWLKYETGTVNGKNDIKAYVLKPVPLNVKKECNFEDDNKNILREDGTFIVSEKMPVNLKFKAHDGILRNIAITNDNRADFIETESDNSPQEGSEIIIKLKGIKSVLWEAVIHDVPPWNNLAAPCPYGIVQRHNMQDLELSTKKEYRFIYDVSTHTLTVLDLSVNKAKPHDKTILYVDDRLSIMRNITSTITKLVLTDIENNSVDLILRKTFKKYLSSATTSPIIVSKCDNDEPLDISAAYREVVIPRTKIALYSKERPLVLKENIPANASRIKLYGINKGTNIDIKANNIKDFAEKYELISADDFSRMNNTVNLNKHIREKYDYIAIEYQSVEDFIYEFTNYEREVFDGKSNILSLEKKMAQRDEDIIIYAIPNSSVVREKYLYRVPSAGMINSIDYYSDRYDIVPPDLYRVNLEENGLSISEKITDGQYRLFVVDYLKKDSYTINFRDKYYQYEINVATEEEKIRLRHDVYGDGSIDNYVRTNILPDKDKYIVLEEREAP